MVFIRWHAEEFVPHMEPERIEQWQCHIDDKRGQQQQTDAPVSDTVHIKNNRAHLRVGHGAAEVPELLREVPDRHGAGLLRVEEVEEGLELRLLLLGVRGPGGAELRGPTISLKLKVKLPYLRMFSLAWLLGSQPTAGTAVPS